MPLRVGYNWREEADPILASKGSIGYDFEKVDYLSVAALGMEYSPTLPTGTATLVADITATMTKFNFNAGLGLANTLHSGYIRIGTEEMKLLSNSGVGPGLVAGQLVVERGAKGTKPAFHAAGSPITFVGPYELKNRQAWVVYNETAASVLYINPESYECDPFKSYPVTPGTPWIAARSAINSVWMFASLVDPIAVRVINCW